MSLDVILVVLTFTMKNEFSFELSSIYIGLGLNGNSNLITNVMTIEIAPHVLFSMNNPVLFKLNIMDYSR